MEKEKYRYNVGILAEESSSGTIILTKKQIWKERRQYF